MQHEEHTMLGWWWLAAAWALQMDLTYAELAAKAELVCAVEVTTVETRWAGLPEGDLETEVFVAPLASVRGQPRDDLSVVLARGQLGPFVTWTEDEPELREDRRYLLFLVRDDTGRYRVLGGERGAMPLRSKFHPRAPALDDLPNLVRELGIPANISPLAAPVGGGR